MALTLQPIRCCPQHSLETRTRLSSAIHRRLLSRFFLREGGHLYTSYCYAEVSLFTEMDITNLKMRNYSLSFNPWLHYLTNKLCSKSNIMIIRIFFKTIETHYFQLHLCYDNKSLFSLFVFFLPGSQIEARTGGRVYGFFCDVRQLYIYVIR